jgi:hypothetical protein
MLVSATRLGDQEGLTEYEENLVKVPWILLRKADTAYHTKRPRPVIFVLIIESFESESNLLITIVSMCWGSLRSPSYFLFFPAKIPENRQLKEKNILKKI